MTQPSQLTRNILRVYRNATEEEIETGSGWYDSALDRCTRLARNTTHSVEQAVAALAHLSPRVQWTANTRALEALLSGEAKPAGLLGRSWQIALEASVHEEPLTTFSARALKTKAFALSILGDHNAVCVDVWAARAAGVEDSVPFTRSGYVMLAEAYRRAGAREGVSPRDLQAIVWCRTRGKAH